MNTNELRAFAGEYLGKEVEFYNDGKWVKGILVAVDVRPESNLPFMSDETINYDICHTEARPPQPKQMRDMTPLELWGKTLVRGDEAFVVTEIEGNKIRIKRTDRPDEWGMDELSRKAFELEKERDELLEELEHRNYISDIKSIVNHGPVCDDLNNIEVQNGPFDGRIVWKERASR